MKRKFFVVSLATNRSILPLLFRSAGHHSPGLAEVLGNARGQAYIGKGAIAVVVEEPTRGGLIERRDAIPGLVVGNAVEAFCFAEFDEVTDEQVQTPVVVVVEPDRARGPARGRHTSLLGDVGKGPVAVIVIENALPILGHVEIGETVAVVVTHGDSLSVASRGHAGLSP